MNYLEKLRASGSLIYRPIIESMDGKINYFSQQPWAQDERAKAFLRVVKSLGDNCQNIAGWLVKEYQAKRIQINRENDFVSQYETGDYVYLGIRYVNHIADWQRAKHANLMGMTISQVEDAITEWDEELRRKEAEEYKNGGKVVYDCGGGYTIRTVPAEDAKAEGQKMGHCVGGYCKRIADNDVQIYSLRDRKNEPHVTIELNDTGFEHIKVLKQVQGKSDKRPADEYCYMVSDWLNDGEWQIIDKTGEEWILPDDAAEDLQAFSLDYFGENDNQYKIAKILTDKINHMNISYQYIDDMSAERMKMYADEMEADFATLRRLGVKRLDAGIKLACAEWTRAYRTRIDQMYARSVQIGTEAENVKANLREYISDKCKVSHDFGPTLAFLYLPSSPYYQFANTSIAPIGSNTVKDIKGQKKFRFKGNVV